MYPPFNKFSNFDYELNCKTCGLRWFSECIEFKCSQCNDSNIEYFKLTKDNNSINKQDLKDALKDMFRSGEIKVNFSFEDLWDEAHLSIDIDDEEVYHGSAIINISKEDY